MKNQNLTTLLFICIFLTSCIKQIQPDCPCIIDYVELSNGRSQYFNIVYHTINDTTHKTILTRTFYSPKDTVLTITNP
jgi:NADH:ubiquinone oxidoreductase subunit C